MIEKTPVTIPTLSHKGRCPMCGRPTQVRTRPFCSRRCADIDLARWLGGGYVVSHPTAVDDEDLPLSSDDAEQ